MATLVTFEIDVVTPEILRALLRGLVAVNRDHMRRAKASGRPLPRLYESGVVYDRLVPIGARTGHWECVLTVLRQGAGDCEALACWRCAELQEDGVLADVEVVVMPDGESFHTLVLWPQGLSEYGQHAFRAEHLIVADGIQCVVEDPSMVLGRSGDRVQLARAR